MMTNPQMTEGVESQRMPRGQRGTLQAGVPTGGGTSTLQGETVVPVLGLPGPEARSLVPCGCTLPFHGLRGWHAPSTPSPDSRRSGCRVSFPLPDGHLHGTSHLLTDTEWMEILAAILFPVKSHFLQLCPRSSLWVTCPSLSAVLMCVTRKASRLGSAVSLGGSSLRAWSCRAGSPWAADQALHWPLPADSADVPASPQNADASESASYPPAGKEKKKYANNGKNTFLRAHTFKRDTDRFSQVPVQLPSEDPRCTTCEAATCKEMEAQPGSDLGAPLPGNELNRGRLISVKLHASPWPVPQQGDRPPCPL